MLLLTLHCLKIAIFCLRLFKTLTWWWYKNESIIKCTQVPHLKYTKNFMWNDEIFLACFDLGVWWMCTLWLMHLIVASHLQTVIHSFGIFKTAPNHHLTFKISYFLHPWLNFLCTLFDVHGRYSYYTISRTRNNNKIKLVAWQVQ